MVRDVPRNDRLLVSLGMRCSGLVLYCGRGMTAVVRNTSCGKLVFGAVIHGAWQGLLKIKICWLVPVCVMFCRRSVSSVFILIFFAMLFLTLLCPRVCVCVCW